MSFQDWSVVAELVSALGVVITLFYVAAQIRRSNRASRTESLNTAIGTHVNQIAHLTATNESSRLFRKFARDFDSLSLDERGRVQAMMLERVASFNQVSVFHVGGLLSDDEFHAMRGTFVSILRTPGGRRWWGLYPHMVPRPVDDAITSALEDPGIEMRPYTEELPWLFEDRWQEAERVR